MVGWALGACTFVEGLLPVPDCEDVVSIDPATGAAELELDERECFRDDLVPDRVTYAMLLDGDSLNPLTDPGALPCNTASVPLLEAELAGLAVDPADFEEFGAFVDGAWTSVQFWDRLGRTSSGSNEGWYALFRFGREEVVTSTDCDAYWEALRDR